MARSRFSLPTLPRDESGNVLIETALLIPVVLVFAFGVVAVGRVAQAQVAVQSVVREATRSLAIAPSGDAGLRAAETNALAVAAGYGLDAGRLQLVIDAGAFARGGTVHADATYPVALGELPWRSPLQVSVSASHQARIDQYRSRAGATP